MKYPPRTRLDFELFEKWLWNDLSEEQINLKTSSPFWRSEVTEGSEGLLCAVCTEKITHIRCNECGQ